MTDAGFDDQMFIDETSLHRNNYNGGNCCRDDLTSS